MTASVNTRRQQVVDGVKIITSSRKYPLLWWWDLPDRWKREYPKTEYAEQFVIYRRWCYLVGDFTCATQAAFRNWDGYMSDTFFSGILIKFIDDDDDYVYMGRYYS